MIKHIVCFKLKNNSEEKKQEAKNVLLSMTDKVNLIKAIEVGTDFLGSPRSYDVILQVTLENKEALDLYQNDDYHCNEVKPYMHSVMESSVAVDYEL
ncbi:MAG: Dabb family protein [Eubacterium sp.]|nr:Dabb family protein [Eubacterium sp.]